MTNIKKAIPGHITIKLLKTKYKEKNLKLGQKKKTWYFQARKKNKTNE